MPTNPLPFRVVKRKLELLGFSITTQKGSHIKFVKRIPEGTITTIVPNHKEITIGTLKSILKQANISETQFDSI